MNSLLNRTAKPLLGSAARASQIQRRTMASAKGNPWNDPATYPIIVIIGGPCLLCAAQCGRYLFRSPEVHTRAHDRVVGGVSDPSKWERWTSHKRSVALMIKNPINEQWQ